MSHTDSEKKSLGIALLTVSDTRSSENDTSGDYLATQLQTDGHRLVDRQLVPDDKYFIRATLANWVITREVQVVLITGGTGFASRDVTPEAVGPLLDTEIPGFGELFRQVSHGEIGSSTIQSRCLAGFSNNTLVFCLPGSPGACRTAWESILGQQLDSTHKPCNFATQV
mgnify:CR=1 FL=1